MTELSFLVEGLRVETRGLRSIGHAELALEVANATQLPAARAYLTSLAAQIVGSGYRYAPGDEVDEQGLHHRFEVAALELWEQDLAGAFTPGCPLLMSMLLGGE